MDVPLGPGATPFARPPPLSGADVAQRLATLRRLQTEGSELARSPLPPPLQAGEPCTPARLRGVDAVAARAPPQPPAPALRFDDDGDGGDDLDPEGGIMSGFRRVAAAGFLDAPPSAQELQAQKAAAQLAELRRLREAAAELLRGRDGDASGLR